MLHLLTLFTLPPGTPKAASSLPHCLGFLSSQVLQLPWLLFPRLVLSFSPLLCLPLEAHLVPPAVSM